MKNIAIITARSGSKGLKDKNIKILCGKPLLYYSIKAAQESGMFQEIMVSTDSERYADIAKHYGAKVPFLRPANLSGDDVTSCEVIMNVLMWYKEKGKHFDTVCLLQPTSPLRIASDIVSAYKLLYEKNVSAVTSVCEAEHSPLWCMTLPTDYSLDDYNKRDDGLPRQMLSKYYRLNGAIYIRKVIYDNVGVKINNKKDIAFIMPKERSIDIDDKLDFYFAEYIMKSQLI